MIELCHGSVFFPPLRDRGPDTRLSSPCHFSGPVNDACCVLTGINYGFTDEDHHVFRTTIRLSCQLNGDVVSVLCTFGFRDSSGFFDDRYDGLIEFCVIADVGPRTPDFQSSIGQFIGTEIFRSRQAQQLPTMAALPSGHPQAGEEAPSEIATSSEK
jgi:hypothetical protein